MIQPPMWVVHLCNICWGLLLFMYIKSHLKKWEIEGRIIRIVEEADGR